MQQLAAPELFSSASNDNETLQAVYQSAIDQSLSVVLWHLPNSDTLHAIVDFSEQKYFRVDQLKNLPFGFVFSKFSQINNGDSLFIKAGLHLEMRVSKNIKIKKNINSKLEHEKYGLFIRQYNKSKNTFSRKWFSCPDLNKEKVVSNRTDYCRLVNTAIDEIVRNNFDKIVVSRVVNISLPDDFDPINVFTQLKKNYPHLFISLVAMKSEGTWIGVSPENLLTVKKDALIVVSLAGTQAQQNNIALGDLLWKTKERREQDLVSHYIRSFLKKKNVGWKEKGPETVSAGKIAHLQTTFTIPVNEDNKLYLVRKIIDELHPTSAICGIPKNKSLSFILKHEHHDRSFYCGFLGPVNLQQEIYLFVNIRCMQIAKKEAYLYAGTGITSDSIAEDEWIETILKIETLLSVLL